LKLEGRKIPNVTVTDISEIYCSSAYVLWSVKCYIFRGLFWKKQRN